MDPASGTTRTEPESAMGRGAAFGFGLVLLAATSIAGLFGLLPILAAIMGNEQAMGVVGVLVIMPLFSSMAIVLGGATVSVLRYAFTGQRGSMLSRGSLTAFGIVLGALLVVATIGAVISGDFALIGGAFEGIFILALMWRFARSRHPGA